MSSMSSSSYPNPLGLREVPESRQKALQEELKELVDVVGPAPLVDLLLERAFQLRATDLHFDPTDEGLRIRIRVDGVLHDVVQLRPDMMAQVISRIKLMAGMDITERRVAQDGHISNAALKARRDIRVGSGPTIHGERLVLRLMPDESTYTRLEELGLDDNQSEAIKAGLRRPYGMMLVVGPVGSGKSTTMYSCLDLLNVPGRSLVTIEDPVERRMKGVSQIQVDPKIDFGFVEALRGVLRQDPDVVMVGEIRDPETAHIAVRAGLTGIRVLSTLHASDTAATVDMLRDFGIPPMFIADSINCIVSVRLLRKICAQSRQTYNPDPAECKILGIDPDKASTVHLARGVPAPCNFHTGYSGRTGAFEVLPITTEMRNGILDGMSASELREIAIENGMSSLEKSAIRKVLAGVTTIEEMHRVLVAEG